MTIQECMNQNLTRIRLPWWESTSYVELQRTPKGEYGLPCTLKSSVSTDMNMKITQLEGYTEWEEYRND